MASALQQMKQTLKSQGHSMTRPRVEIFTALQQHQAQTLHQLVTHCPTVDRATIYRTVELYESLGILQRLQIGWKYRLELTDNFVEHHHHLTCTNCGRIIDLAEDVVLERRLNELATALDFQATDHLLEVRGLCADCQR